MLLDGRKADLPTAHCMTLRAIRAHLPPVDVLVAVSAILANVRKHRFHVALDARHFLVQSTKWIVRFVVIEFRHRSDGAPTGSCVTVLTGDRERAVRILRCLVLRIARLVRCQSAIDCWSSACAWEH